MSYKFSTIIAIDGPAGAGKSTLARLLAKRLGYLYIDTGAMYRALTYKALKNKIDFKDPKAIRALIKTTSISLKRAKKGNLKIFLDGKDITFRIRSPKVNSFVSIVAKDPLVRKWMLKLQRALGKRKAVLEGRDIGTVVFPRAGKKFFLDASFEERARRRYKELKEKFSTISLREVKKDLKRRDYIDSTRKYAPLKKADDAIYIDTTNLTIKQVLKRLLKEIDFRYG